MAISDEHELLLREAAKIVDALAQTLAPLCEVVLHDLRNPDHSIVSIGNNLSGRKIGAKATELGLARIADPDFPDLLINYPNTFDDGRAVKSTSIGLKDSEGTFVAAICLNMDVSYLRFFSSYLNDFTKTVADKRAKENLINSDNPSIETEILRFASTNNKDPRSLTSNEKRHLIRQLNENNVLNRRGAAEQISKILGVSRSSIYYYLDAEK